jgi:hypothetical protein
MSALWALLVEQYKKIVRFVIKCEKNLFERLQKKSFGIFIYLFIECQNSNLKETAKLLSYGCLGVIVKGLGLQYTQNPTFQIDFQIKHS